MRKIAKPLSDDELEFVDEDDGPVEETRKAVTGFTPTQGVSWPWGSAAPPKEAESALDADKRTRIDAAKANRVLGNREEADKARQEDHRADPGTSIEAKYATGFTREAGKHVAHTGPLTRDSGRLKIFPEGKDWEWIEENTAILQDTAKQVLHGRNATIFENCVTNPLRGLGNYKSAVQDMAARFNIPDTRVYKIIDKCKQRVTRAIRGVPHERPPKRTPMGASQGIHRGQAILVGASPRGQRRQALY